jgi:hypothetical protein
VPVAEAGAPDKAEVADVAIDEKPVVTSGLPALADCVAGLVGAEDACSLMRL